VSIRHDDSTIPARRAAATPRRRVAARRGLSLVEVLISLAITATLLTAVSGAYVASAKAIELNDQFFRASQAARVSVTRISSELRKCRSGTLYGDDTLELITASGEKHTYKHDPVNKWLTLTLDLPVPRTHKLASNVTSCKFYSNGKSVTVNVTVAVGKNSVALNGSAIPRRAVEY
jgi:prepilin-type N-terminal cleavage/methylation domain-containing protein